MISLNVLTAYPGTDLYERMKKDGRINAIDTDMLGIYPTMRYMHISQAEMFRKFFAVIEKMYSYEVVLQKAGITLGNGHFTHYNEADISIMDKVRSMAYLFRQFLVTDNPAKKELYKMLFGLVRQKKVSIGNVIEYLLLIASFNGYLQATASHRAAILTEIQAVAPGPIDR